MIEQEPDITVTVTPDGNGGHNIEYSPREYHRKVGQTTVRLELKDPETRGYQFTDFRWVPLSLAQGYFKSLQIEATSIELGLRGHFNHKTQYGYEVFVGAGGADANLTALATLAVRTIASTSAGLADELDVLGTVCEEPGQQMPQTLMLRRNGPVIENDPG